MADLAIVFLLHRKKIGCKGLFLWRMIMDNKEIKILDMIIDDVQQFDGQPLTGKAFIEYLGNIEVAIITIAEILKKNIEQQIKNNKKD